MFALNCAIRNGDAHLKNFGITYANVQGDLRLAPIYDLVTTWAYIPNDPMALTLNGSTRWPDRARLIELARVRCEIMPRNTVRQKFRLLARLLAGRYSLFIARSRHTNPARGYRAK